MFGFFKNTEGVRLQEIKEELKEVKRRKKERERSVFGEADRLAKRLDGYYGYDEILSRRELNLGPLIRKDHFDKRSNNTIVRTLLLKYPKFSMLEENKRDRRYIKLYKFIEDKKYRDKKYRGTDIAKLENFKDMDILLKARYIPSDIELKYNYKPSIIWWVTYFSNSIRSIKLYKRYFGKEVKFTLDEVVPDHKSTIGCQCKYCKEDKKLFKKLTDIDIDNYITLQQDRSEGHGTTERSGYYKEVSEAVHDVYNFTKKDENKNKDFINFVTSNSVTDIVKYIYLYDIDGSEESVKRAEKIFAINLEDARSNAIKDKNYNKYKEGLNMFGQLYVRRPRVRAPYGLLTTNEKLDIRAAMDRQNLVDAGLKFMDYLKKGSVSTPW